MRQFLFLIGLLFLAPSLSGQSTTSSPSAEDLLKTTRDKLNRMENLAATFEKTLSFEGGRSVSHTGYLKMMGERFRINVQNQEVISDGESLWQINKLDEEVLIKPYDPEEGFSPNALFNLSSKGMTTKRFSKRELESGTVAWPVQLVPEDPAEKQYSKVHVYISTESHLPVFIKTWLKNGSVVKYDIQKMQTNVPDLTKESFVFRKQNFPDYYVEDFRED